MLIKHNVAVFFRILEHTIQVDYSLLSELSSLRRAFFRTYSHQNVLSLVALSNVFGLTISPRSCYAIPLPIQILRARFPYYVR